jgi:hypothetical protein
VILSQFFALTAALLEARGLAAAAMSRACGSGLRVPSRPGGSALVVAEEYGRIVVSDARNGSASAGDATMSYCVLPGRIASCDLDQPAGPLHPISAVAPRSDRTEQLT